eukprot:1144042-Pelagomonas_calceolata.AAC.1
MWLAAAVPQEKSDPSPRALKPLTPVYTLIMNQGDHRAQIVVDQARPMMKGGKRVKGPGGIGCWMEFTTGISTQSLDPKVALIDLDLDLHGGTFSQEASHACKHGLPSP